VQISIHALTKTYRGGVRALDDVDLEIPPGMFGLLGANGAGKTTLMRILAGILRPSAGTVHINDHDVQTAAGRSAVQRTLGYLPQDLGVYPDLSAHGFLDYIAILKGIDSRTERNPEVERLLELVGLSEVAQRKLGAMSGGMQRRVGIAQALIGDPRLLIVDEPTAGLDPEERVRFRTLLANLGRDRTVLLSTHIVEDVASACRNLTVMGAGRLLYTGTTTELIEGARGLVWSVDAEAGAIDERSVSSAMHLGDRVAYRVVALTQPTPDAQQLEPSLEDGYLALMRGLSDPQTTRAGAAL